MKKTLFQILAASLLWFCVLQIYYCAPWRQRLAEGARPRMSRRGGAGRWARRACCA